MSQSPPPGPGTSRPARFDAGRSRAGNAMARTRAAVLSGARACVQKHGVKRTTMVDVAVTAGVAKATLYNHFRTKAEVLTALVDSEVSAAGAETTEAAETQGLPVALARLAERLGEHPVVRRLVAQEPAVLIALVLPGEEPAAGWAAAREAVRGLLVPVVEPEELPHASETVLRWLVSALLWPVGRAEASWAVGRLLAAAPVQAQAAASAVAAAPDVTDLPGEEPMPAPAPVAGLPAPDQAPTAPGLGFPGERARGAADLATVAVPVAVPAR